MLRDRTCAATAAPRSEGWGRGAHPVSCTPCLGHRSCPGCWGHGGARVRPDPAARLLQQLPPWSCRTLGWARAWAPGAALGSVGAPGAALGSIGAPGAALHSVGALGGALGSVGAPGAALHSVGAPGVALGSIRAPGAALGSVGALGIQDAPGTGGCSRHHGMLGTGNALDLWVMRHPQGTAGRQQVPRCCHLRPDVATRAPQHCRSRASAPTDVSEQLISSDRATAASLPRPQGGQGLVTQDPATQHPPRWTPAPTRDPQGSGQTQPLAKGASSPRQPGARWGLTCRAGVLIPCISSAGRESISSSWELGRCQD